MKHHHTKVTISLEIDYISLKYCRSNLSAVNLKIIRCHNKIIFCSCILIIKLFNCMNIRYLSQRGISVFITCTHTAIALHVAASTAFKIHLNLRIGIDLVNLMNNMSWKKIDIDFMLLHSSWYSACVYLLNGTLHLYSWYWICNVAFQIGSDSLRLFLVVHIPVSPLYIFRQTKCGLQ